jgi:hypothetical protein
MEDALKRLDKLTQEEARMAAVENLRATHAVDERVRGVASTVLGIDSGVARVDDRVARVDDRVAGVDHMVAIVNDIVKGIDTRLKVVDDKAGEVINGAQNHIQPIPRMIANSRNVQAERKQIWH